MYEKFLDRIRETIDEVFDRYTDDDFAEDMDEATVMAVYEDITTVLSEKRSELLSEFGG